MVVMDKYAQVAQVLKEKNIGLWLLMGRETVDICDPGLRLVLPSNIMGVSAFFAARMSAAWKQTAYSTVLLATAMTSMICCSR